MLSAQLQRAIEATGQWLAQDKAAQAELNALGQAFVTHVIAPRRREIGGFVAQVVAGWDARMVADKLELQVGKDLQYIRVNGILVGGLVGVLIFAVAHWARPGLTRGPLELQSGAAEGVTRPGAAIGPS